MFNIGDVFTPAGLAALGQVILIDLMLAGDNVLVLGTLAAGFPRDMRKRVLAIGVGASMVCLIVFALLATQLLNVVGLLFAGGVLLFLVTFRLFHELWSARRDEAVEAIAPTTSLWRASAQVVLADLSMSLDNVLAVAGAARQHPAVLFFGLALSVTLMAVAANYIAKLIERHRWLGYIGLLVIFYVAGSMVYHGWTDASVGLGPRLKH